MTSRNADIREAEARGVRKGLEAAAAYLDGRAVFFNANPLMIEHDQLRKDCRRWARKIRKLEVDDAE